MADTAPVSLKLSLGSDAITLGEPVILGYEIVNGSHVKVVVDLGVERTAWLMVEVRDEAGTLVPTVPDYRPKACGGLRPLSTVELPPGASYRGDRVVSETFAFPKASTYRVVARAHVPYLLNAGAEGGTFSDERTLVLTVAKEDPARLEGTLRSLQAAAIGKQKSVEQRETAVIALFSMPESKAIKTWQALAADSSLPLGERLVIVGQLLRIGSPKAVDLLAEMWGDPKQLADVRSQAKIALLNLWWSGGDVVRKDIEKVFAAREGTMPKVTGPIVPVD